MMNLGEKLRRARQARRIGLSQAALETRIREKMLEALEASDYASLPPRPFVRGLLRNYASYLNLEPDVALDEYDIETGYQTASQSSETAAPPLAPRAPEPVPFTPPPDFAQPPEPFIPPTTPESQAPTRTRLSDFPPFRLPGLRKKSSAAAPADQPGQLAAPDFRLMPADEPPREPSAPGSGEAASREPPTLAQRIGATRIPEIVAILSLAVALFGLVSLGFDQYERLLFFTSNASQRPTPTPSRTIVPGSSPTGVPTLAETLEAATRVPVVDATATASLTPQITAVPLTPTLSPDAGAQMTLEIVANGPLWVRVIVDNVEDFAGEMQNSRQIWSARERIYFQVKNIGNGRVLFNGARILPRVHAERTDLQRAWQMNTRNTPIAVQAEPYPTTPTATATVTYTPTPTFTPTSTFTRTSIPTRTLTPSITPTATRTWTPSLTPTLTLSTTPSKTLDITSTATLSPTTIVVRTATPSPTLTP